MFPKFTLLYGIAANVNMYNSTVPEENGLCQQRGRLERAVKKRQEAEL